MEHAWLDYLFKTTRLRTELEKRIADEFIRSLAGRISNGSLAPFGNPPFSFPSYASPYIELHGGTRARLIRKTFDPFLSRPSLQPLIPRIKFAVAIKWRKRSRSGLFRFRALRRIVVSSRCDCHSREALIPMLVEWYVIWMWKANAINFIQSSQYLV